MLIVFGKSLSRGKKRGALKILPLRLGILFTELVNHLGKTVPGVGYAGLGDTPSAEIIIIRLLDHFLSFLRASPPLLNKLYCTAMGLILFRA